MEYSPEQGRQVELIADRGRKQSPENCELEGMKLPAGAHLDSCWRRRRIAGKSLGCVGGRLSSPEKGHGVGWSYHRRATATAMVRRCDCRGEGHQGILSEEEATAGTEQELVAGLKRGWNGARVPLWTGRDRGEKQRREKGLKIPDQLCSFEGLANCLLQVPKFGNNYPSHLKLVNVQLNEIFNQNPLTR